MNYMQRKIITYILLIILFYGSLVFAQTAQTVFISFFPEEIRQGDPFMAQIDGAKISSIKKLTFNGKKMGILLYQEKPTALIPVDLNKKAKTYELRAELTDGNIIKKDVVIVQRDKKETPLGIPEKLGGNTKASQNKLVSTLNADNKKLAGLRTNGKSLWKEKFIAPLRQIVVTSPYGNSRKTGEYAIPHKGTDYKAPEGTEILAINRGVVRFAKTLRNHGKTIVIDHGQGVMSFYLHLSKFKVKKGVVVERGKVIALSGATGYTLGAHLHFGLRINDIAIDPEKFFELFKDTN